MNRRTSTIPTPPGGLGPSRAMGHAGNSNRPHPLLCDFPKGVK